MCTVSLQEEAEPRDGLPSYLMGSQHFMRLKGSTATAAGKGGHFIPTSFIQKLE